MSGRLGLVALGIVACVSLTTTRARAEDFGPAAATAPVNTVPPRPAEAAPGFRYVFQGPLDETIAYHGSYDLDGAGLGAQNILYAAPGAIGLAVAVITHGVIVNAMQTSQKKRIQAAADEAMAPYADVLEHFGQRELLERSRPLMTSSPGRRGGANDGASGTERVVGYEPAFAVSQDGRALIIENVVSVGVGDPAWRNMIRVVSDPLGAEDPVAYWTADGGSAFKDQSARLLAISLDVAMAEATGPVQPVGTQRSVRYRLGAVEKVERAEVLAQTCDRVLMRTLRGWLMSAPRVLAATSNGDVRACDVAVAR